MIRPRRLKMRSFRPTDEAQKAADVLNRACVKVPEVMNRVLKTHPTQYVLLFKASKCCEKHVASNNKLDRAILTRGRTQSGQQVPTAFCGSLRPKQLKQRSTVWWLTTPG